MPARAIIILEAEDDTRMNISGIIHAECQRPVRITREIVADACKAQPLFFCWVVVTFLEPFFSTTFAFSSEVVPALPQTMAWPETS